MVSAYQEGKFLADPESRGKPRPNPMSDPAAMEGMMGMMKGNMAMMIPQTLIMGWINAFFSGFVISKCSPLHRTIVAATACRLAPTRVGGRRASSKNRTLALASLPHVPKMHACGMIRRE